LSFDPEGIVVGRGGYLFVADFLVLDRDSRCLGIEVTPTPVHKRIYRISLCDAMDVQDISLANSDDLPSGVIPVSKEPFIDVLAQLTDARQTVPEKLEGLAIGPRLADGSYVILLGTDNDYSVTQTGAGEQFDICVDATEKPPQAFGHRRR
jgi:hypothetical protein